MGTENTLLDLAALCEAAEGADRELDCLIVRALYPEASIAPYVVGDDELTVFHAEPLIRNKSALPPFTASLDAARQLVPEGWGWNVSWPNLKARESGLLRADAPCRGEVEYGCDSRHIVAAATPALALCAAALKARAAS